jgi:hypothetical protein
MGSRSPELAEVIRTWIAGARADIHTALPAKVTRVDLAKGLVDVKPLIKSGWENDDGDRVVEAVPVICDVPIAFPGAGGMRVTFPVTVDDTGLVLFSEASLDAWLDAPAGNDVDPLDDRRHHLSDGIFLPGLRPASSPWTADASVLTIGSDGGAADFVALAAKVNQALSDFRTWANGHTHLVAGVQAGASSVSSNAPTGALGAAASVASATVKVKG